MIRDIYIIFFFFSLFFSSSEINFFTVFLSYSHFFLFIFFFFHFFLFHFFSTQSQKDTNASFIFHQNEDAEKMSNSISAFSFEMDIGAGKLLFPRKYSITNCTSGTLRHSIYFINVTNFIL